MTCTGGMFCDGSRAGTAADDAAYHAKIAALGGYGSPRAQAWIREQERLYRESTRNHVCTNPTGGCGLLTLVFTLPLLVGGRAVARRLLRR